MQKYVKKKQAMNMHLIKSQTKVKVAILTEV